MCIHVGIVCIIIRICMCVGEGEAIILTATISGVNHVTILRKMNHILKIRLRKWYNRWRCHRDMCFPGIRVSRAHIPRDACFPTHISLKQQLATSHSDMCVPGKCVSLEISLNFASSPQFEP